MDNKDCCCKDIHKDTCFTIQFPNYNPLAPDFDYPETCECHCHDQYDDDECDCYDYVYPTDEDREEFKDDYELMKQLTINEAITREKDARDRERELKQYYPYKYIDKEG